jgi:membrane protease YdiL (CAAX protease family)
MTIQPLTRRDLQFAAVTVGLITLCTGYVLVNYSKAFPAASLDLTLSKTQITEHAAAFAASQHWSTSGFRNITVFDPDDNARLYLERELGLSEANRLMRTRVSVWRWRVRWFRPPGKEEFVVYLRPDGAITGFNHVVDEAASGARLASAAAQELAAHFVSSQTSEPVHLVENHVEQKPNRYDYSFTWEDENFRAKTATYRRTVVVQGDRIGRYSEFLYVPETWTREFAAMRSKNDLYAGIAQACWIPLILAAIGLGIRALRRHVVPWRPLVLIAAAVSALMIVNHVNSLPFLIDEFPTSSPYSQTIFLLLLQALGAGVGVFLYVIVAAAPGESLYAGIHPGGLSLRNAFTRNGVASRDFFRATIAGYGLAAAHLAFLVAFYLIGRRFGVWSPQDVEYSDMLSTPLPWIYPIAIASLAACAEEFWFRLFAIPLLRRVLKQTWLAIIIPAFLWGFLHANYPQEPAWIRGFEVGVIGVAAGLVMLRFSIVATLIWHYTIDALLIGMFLFQAQSWYFRVSGWILGAAILCPLILSAALYRRNRGFVAIEPWESAPAAIEQPVKPPSWPPVGAPWPAWRLYAAAAAALGASILVHTAEFGDWIRIRIDRNQAQAIAARAVPNPSSWRIATNFVENLNAAEFEYLRRIAGAAAAQTAVRDHQVSAVWRSRFFRPQNKEEWIIYVTQDGRVARTDHLLDERASGANLGIDQARQAVEKALPTANLTLVDSNQHTRDNRTDYAFTFEDPAFRIGEARARISIELHGVEPSNLTRFIKLPEAWLRDFEAPSVRKLIIPAMIGAAMVPLLVLFLRRIAAPEIVLNWRVYSLIGFSGLLVATASAINGSAIAWAGYNTAMPEQTYLTQYLIGRGIISVFVAGALFAAALAVDVFRQVALGRATLNRPSLLRAAAVAALIVGLSRAVSWAIEAMPGPRENLPVWNLGGLDAYLPGWRAFANPWLLAILSVCGAAAGVFVVMRYFRGRRRLALIAIVVLGLSSAQSLTPVQFLASVAAVLIWLAAITLVVLTCAADLIGLGVAMFWALAIPEALKLAQQPAPWIRWNGVAAAIASVVVGIAVIVTLNARRSVPRAQA